MDDAIGRGRRGVPAARATGASEPRASFAKHHAPTLINTRVSRPLEEMTRVRGACHNEDFYESPAPVTPLRSDRNGSSDDVTCFSDVKKSLSGTIVSNTLRERAVFVSSADRRNIPSRNETRKTRLHKNLLPRQTLKNKCLLFVIIIVR